MAKIISITERFEVRTYQRIMTAEERMKFKPEDDGQVVGVEITSAGPWHVYLKKEIFCIDANDVESAAGIVRRCALMGLSELWGQGRVSVEHTSPEPSAGDLDDLFEEDPSPTGPLTDEERVFIGLRPQ